MTVIAPSLLEADYQHLGTQLQLMKKAGAEYVHIDVMDGNYVPNLSFGFKMIQGLRSAADLVFDVHMMVQKPERFLERMQKAGADVLTVHYEACSDILNTILAIKDLGIKAGIVLNPQTPTEVLTDEMLHLADVVQLMTVEPGIEGQKFHTASLKKIRRLKERITQSGSRALIEADGGIDLQNVQDVVRAGTDIVVSGKALFQGDLYRNISEMNCLLSGQEE